MMSYRPVSLLETFSKILETAVFNRFNKHLEVSSILVYTRAVWVQVRYYDSKSNLYCT
jgi:hypothetical protein